MRVELIEKTLESHMVYEGTVISVRQDLAELPDGHAANRELVEHPGGAAVVPLHEDGTVTLVRQYRYPMGRVMLEIPAGKLDRGEEPRACALRELEEETGLVCGRFTPLGSLAVSPGYSNEVLHLYLAQELSQASQHLDETEFVALERVPFQDALARVMSGEIVDAKTVAGILKTKVLLGL